ncbi:MAG TPA: maltose ABC transporter substrate-binding protein [Ilumatobacteraceae bacterium]|nr:maltose ABC transporter substrate-binding protein [Ilumatobacteraceae bacterium]
MRASRRLIAFAAVAALVGAACGSDDTSDSSSAEDTTGTETTDAPDTTEAATDTTEATTETTEAATTETTEYQPPARGDADLVIWADDTRTPVLEPIAAAFSEAEGVNVQVLEVPFDQIRDNLSVQGPAGEGPDIIIGAHDWLGELVSNGVVEPLDLGPAAAEYSEVAVQAFTYDGQTYGLPYAIENIALIRNADLVPEAPATFEELEEIALGLLADGTVTVPLAVQQDPADPFHNYPLFSAMGGYVFGQDEDGSYNADDLGIDSEGGLAAAQKFADWSNSGLISKDVSYDIMIDSFSSGQAPFAITGPWAVGEFSDINFVVEPVPPVEGGTPNVFVGVQGFMVSSFSENVDLAKTFLLDYLNTEELQLALYDAGGRPPAMTSAFDQVAADPIIEGFGLAGQQGAPLPAIPEMSAVWESWTDAYNLVFTGTDPTVAFTDAATSIREAIAG